MAYTNVAKPTGATYTKLAKPSAQLKRGYATGVLGPPTYSQNTFLPGTFYTNVAKPTNSTYTKISKPT